jgi:hypothetical protein
MPRVPGVVVSLVAAGAMFWLGTIVADSRKGSATSEIPIKWSVDPGGLCRIDDPLIKFSWTSGPDGQCEIYMGAFR